LQQILFYFIHDASAEQQETGCVDS